MNFIIRWVVTAVAVAAAVWLVPGITVVPAGDAWVAIILTALILSLLNVSIKPFIQTLSLPLTILTLGIFYLVVNALVLELAAWIANGLFGIGFTISSFGTAVLASIVISFVSMIVNNIAGIED